MVGMLLDRSLYAASSNAVDERQACCSSFLFGPLDLDWRFFSRKLTRGGETAILDESRASVDCSVSVLRLI
jgi:hypothetical protein